MYFSSFLLWAHAGGGGVGDNPFYTPWEVHPTLIHFPIAFFLGGLLLDLLAWVWPRPRLDWTRVATGLYGAGVVMGLITALAGAAAFFTLPGTHTERAHILMYWHLALEAAAVFLFAIIAWRRWREWDLIPPARQRLASLLAAGLFVFASALGGYIVYHGGAGIPRQVFTAYEQNEEHPGGSDHHPMDTEAAE
jgi:uncharacterized membrane protein